MLRFLLSLLALLLPGLAFLFDRPWLNVVTLVIVVAGLGVLGWWFWTTFQVDEPERPRPSPEPDEDEPSLEDFGIVDIQPEDASPRTAAAEESGGSAADAAHPATSAPDDTTETATSAPPSDDEQPATPAAPPATEEAPAEEAPVFGPLLESLRAALDARTVCLLVQEDVALTYRIEAIASTYSALRRSGTFDTQTPLLTATMSRQSVTVRSLAQEEVAVEDLGYYTSAPEVDHLAAAPVSQPDASSTTFLLADAPADADLGTSRARTLLEHFAETIALLLTTDRSVPDQQETPAADGPLNGQGTAAPEAENDTGSADDSDAPRPRREIIAEEMEEAQAAEEDLALALIHLNRAESIARRGEEAVTSAEHLFQARLEQLVPAQRVERFGELTYGIFFRDGADAVEPQVADLKATMAQEEGELEGGVSVGVAVWSDEEPEALREEATTALREAYETGTPTIVT